MLETRKRSDAIGKPDIARLAGQIRIECRVKAARIIAPGAGRWRRLLGIDATRIGRPVTVRLATADAAGGGDHDPPMAIVAETDAMAAGVRIGHLVVLQEDIEMARRTGGAAPAGEIVRTRSGGNEIGLICHWWRRKTGRLGRIDKTMRIDRFELLPGLQARRSTNT